MKLTWLFAFLIGIGFAYSQSNWGFGARAGVNLAFVPQVLEEVKENHSKLRGNAGLFAQYSFSEKWDMRSELNYSLKGTDAVFILKDDFFTDGVDVNADFNLDYLVIPIMARWKFYKQLYLGLGPYIGFLLKNNVHIYTPNYVNDLYGVSADAEGDFNDVIRELRNQGFDYDVENKKLDFGVNIETGYLFSNGVEINVRYSQGLSKIIDGPDFNVNPKNESFFFGLGYRFR